MAFGNAVNKVYHFGQQGQTQQRVIDPSILARAQELAEQELAAQGSEESGSQKGVPLPLKSWRAGSVQVAVWENESLGKDGVVRKYPTVSFKRRYKDKTGHWKSTSTLRLDDLPRAQLLLNQAFAFLVLEEKGEGL